MDARSTGGHGCSAAMRVETHRLQVRSRRVWTTRRLPACATKPRTLNFQHGGCRDGYWGDRAYNALPGLGQGKAARERQHSLTPNQIYVALTDYLEGHPALIRRTLQPATSFLRSLIGTNGFVTQIERLEAKMDLLTQRLQFPAAAGCTRGP